MFSIENQLELLVFLFAAALIGLGFAAGYFFGFRARAREERRPRLYGLRGPL